MLDIISIEKVNEVDEEFEKRVNETKEYIEGLKKEIEGENYIPSESVEDFIARMHREVEEGKKRFENFFNEQDLQRSEREEVI